MAVSKQGMCVKCFKITEISEDREVCFMCFVLSDDFEEELNEEDEEKTIGACWRCNDYPVEMVKDHMCMECVDEEFEEKCNNK